MKSKFTIILQWLWLAIVCIFSVCFGWLLGLGITAVLGPVGCLCLLLGLGIAAAWYLSFHFFLWFYSFTLMPIYAWVHDKIETWAGKTSVVMVVL